MFNQKTSGVTETPAQDSTLNALYNEGVAQLWDQIDTLNSLNSPLERLEEKELQAIAAQKQNAAKLLDIPYKITSAYYGAGSLEENRLLSTTLLNKKSGECQSIICMILEYRLILPEPSSSKNKKPVIQIAFGYEKANGWILLEGVRKGGGKVKWKHFLPWDETKEGLRPFTASRITRSLYSLAEYTTSIISEVREDIEIRENRMNWLASTFPPSY